MDISLIHVDAHSHAILTHASWMTPEDVIRNWSDFIKKCCLLMKLNCVRGEASRTLFASSWPPSLLFPTKWLLLQRSFPIINIITSDVCKLYISASFHKHKQQYRPVLFDIRNKYNVPLTIVPTRDIRCRSKLIMGQNKYIKDYTWDQSASGRWRTLLGHKLVRSTLDCIILQRWFQGQCWFILCSPRQIHLLE